MNISSRELDPLLKVRIPISFDQIRPEHVEPAVAELVEEARLQLWAWENTPTRSNGLQFENTVTPIWNLTAKLEQALAVARHLEAVAGSPEYRQALDAAQREADEYSAELWVNGSLFNQVQEYAASEEGRTLRGSRLRLLKKTLDQFRRHGAGLESAAQSHLRQIEHELAELAVRFCRNVQDATTAFELYIFDPGKLAGLPAFAKERAQTSAAARGWEGWRFTLDDPSYHSAVSSLKDAYLRECLWLAYHRRALAGAVDNRPVIARIAALRQERARLLGFPHFAAYALDESMAGNVGRVRLFLDELKQKIYPRFRQENDLLERFRNDSVSMRPWDIPYYAARQLSHLQGFDEEALRPYFPLGCVLEGLFEICRRLFRIRITEYAGAPVWDPSVKAFWVHDQDGSLLGMFYGDWHPRPNKRGGAWMDPLVVSQGDRAERKGRAGAICCNIVAPSGDTPALLSHREVRILFHEFGHLLHHLLSLEEHRALSPFRSEKELLELPSQLLENWCWEPEALRLLTRHYKSGEPIPQDWLQTIWRMRTYRAANSCMRQLGLSAIDVHLHSDDPLPRDHTLLEYEWNITREFSPLPIDCSFVTTFWHLFWSAEGLGAVYYAYLWAQMMEADAFACFRREGIFSTDLGMSFRNTILAGGGAAGELFAKFMGREPDVKAFLEREGLPITPQPDL